MLISSWMQNRWALWDTVILIHYALDNWSMVILLMKKKMLTADLGRYPQNRGQWSLMLVSCVYRDQTFVWLFRKAYKSFLRVLIHFTESIPIGAHCQCSFLRRRGEVRKWFVHILLNMCAHTFFTGKFSGPYFDHLIPGGMGLEIRVASLTTVQQQTGLPSPLSWHRSVLEVISILTCLMMFEGSWWQESMTYSMPMTKKFRTLLLEAINILTCLNSALIRDKIKSHFRCLFLNIILITMLIWSWF